MKNTLIVLNLLAAILVLPAVSIAHSEYAFSAMRMYVALDRLEILDREKLEKAYPNEMKNDRVLIPKKYMDKTIYAHCVGIPCIVAFLLNSILMLLFWKPKQKKD
jgi:hypothetical protein